MISRYTLVMLLIFGSGIRLFAAQSFTVVVYNVENLFDADGRSLYSDYQPERYTPNHVITKARNAASILAKFRNGAGPDIVLLQELEIDQSPGRNAVDIDAFLAEQSGVSLEALAAGGVLPEAWRDAPSEAWLLKALAEVGVHGYTVVVGSDAPAPWGDKSGPSIKCVTLSKFPVTAVRQYPITSARNIVEVELEVDGQKLYVFNNHWKSGASDVQLERVRIQNAEVLRARLDEIFAQEPMADVVIGGDLNSQYNQKALYPEMVRTGVNDSLKSQGNERALEAGEADLYNLWFELPAALRGSDTYRGEWGTLMHLIVSRGLYDESGIQYEDNSFGLARLVGVNADSAGAPFRWSSAGTKGAGYSDHLPVYAHFRTLAQNRPEQWMKLENPSSEDMSTSARKVDYSGVDLNLAIDIEALPASTDLRDGSWSGRFFKIEGEIIPGQDLKVRVMGKIFDIYAPNRDVKDLLMAQAVKGKRLAFYGELGTYRGNWQFVVNDARWVR
jgi:endonuclease/exonuclease/phosphatase family metal-dependent hydrolase